MDLPREMVTVYWQNLTTKAFSERVVGFADTVVVPVGSISAHGLHLPLGADNFAPEALCQRLEAKHPERIVIAPTIAYGHAWDLARWPGTLSISGRLVADYAAEVGRTMAAWGMRHVVFMNGHAGNIGPLTDAMERIAELGCRVLLINWWLDFSAEIDGVVSEQGHAGEAETSILLAVREDLVYMADARSNPYRRQGVKITSQDMGEKAFRHAMIGAAQSATRAKGTAILERVDERLVQILEDVWADRLFDERRD